MMARFLIPFFGVVTFFLILQSLPRAMAASCVKDPELGEQLTAATRIYIVRGSPEINELKSGIELEIDCKIIDGTPEFTGKFKTFGKYLNALEYETNGVDFKHKKTLREKEAEVEIIPLDSEYEDIRTLAKITIPRRGDLNEPDDALVLQVYWRERPRIEKQDPNEKILLYQVSSTFLKNNGSGELRPEKNWSGVKVAIDEKQSSITLEKPEGGNLVGIGGKDEVFLSSVSKSLPQGKEEDYMNQVAKNFGFSLSKKSEVESCQLQEDPKNENHLIGKCEGKFTLDLGGELSQTSRFQCRFDFMKEFGITTQKERRPCKVLNAPKR